jgi:hypothetical protein
VELRTTVEQFQLQILGRQAMAIGATHLKTQAAIQRERWIESIPHIAR